MDMSIEKGNRNGGKLQNEYCDVSWVLLLKDNSKYEMKAIRRADIHNEEKFRV